MRNLKFSDIDHTKRFVVGRDSANIVVREKPNKYDETIGAKREENKRLLPRAVQFVKLNCDGIENFFASNMTFNLILNF